MFFSGKNVEELLEKKPNLVPNFNPERGFCMQVTENLPNPRTIKTHLPISMINPKIFEEAKVINN